MNLGELLSELRDNMLRDRGDQVGGPSDHLWSDETLIRYINQAYFRFAREALCIRDGETPDVTQVALRANAMMYQLHPSVLAVLSAKVTGDTADLARAGHSDFSGYRTPDTYFFDTAALAVLPPGKPRAYATDEYTSTFEGKQGVVTLRIYPTPNDPYDLRLRVVRLPKAPLVNAPDVPELPETHHLEMLDWAAYLALRIVDHDAEDVPRAQTFKASFEAACKKARDLAMRKMFAPLQHGFGRNGWSWEGNHNYG